MAQRLGIEDILKCLVADWLLGREVQNPPHSTAERAAGREWVDQVRRGDYTPVQGMGGKSRNQQAMWVLVCCIYDLPGCWDAFWRLVGVANANGPAGSEDSSPYGNWWLTSWVGLFAVASRRGLANEAAAARAIARRHLGLFVLGSGMAGGVLAYCIAGPRWHVGRPKGIPWAIGRVFGLKPPSWGAGKHDKQYGEALLDMAFEFLSEAKGLLTEAERAGGQAWILGRHIETGMRSLIAGLWMDGELEIYVGTDGAVDTVCRVLANCYDDPLTNTSWTLGKAPRELRWSLSESTPLWPASSVMTEADPPNRYVTRFHGSVIGPSGKRDTVIDEAVPMGGHMQPLRHRIVINSKGVTIDGDLLPAVKVDIPGSVPAGGGDVDTPQKPKDPQGAVSLDKALRQAGLLRDNAQMVENAVRRGDAKAAVKALAEANFAGMAERLKNLLTGRLT